jgi:hypothetical protein
MGFYFKGEPVTRCWARGLLGLMVLEDELLADSVALNLNKKGELTASSIASPGVLSPWSNGRSSRTAFLIPNKLCTKVHSGVKMVEQIVSHIPGNCGHSCCSKFSKFRVWVAYLSLDPDPGPCLSSKFSNPP